MNVIVNNPRRAYWLKTLHQWHWISSAVSLIGILLFSVTGITLNHSQQIDSAPRISEQAAIVPAGLLAQINALAADAELRQYTPATPPALTAWVKQSFGAELDGSNADWHTREVYFSLQRPGGDAWVSISLRSGGAKYQNTDRGWIAYFNDLHKGRYTGTAWAWCIDLIAAACLMFSITGLFILQLHARNRPATWPLVGFGLLVPLLLALLFIH